MISNQNVTLFMERGSTHSTRQILFHFLQIEQSTGSHGQ
jgi:hypothetical protein